MGNNTNNAAKLLINALIMNMPNPHKTSTLIFDPFVLRAKYSPTRSGLLVLIKRRENISRQNKMQSTPTG
jgi:hypothetical protein